MLGSLLRGRGLKAASQQHGKPPVEPECNFESNSSDTAAPAAGVGARRAMLVAHGEGEAQLRGGRGWAGAVGGVEKHTFGAWAAAAAPGGAAAGLGLPIHCPAMRLGDGVAPWALQGPAGASRGTRALLAGALGAAVPAAGPNLLHRPQGARGAGDRGPRPAGFLPPGEATTGPRPRLHAPVCGCFLPLSPQVIFAGPLSACRSRRGAPWRPARAVEWGGGAGGAWRPPGPWRRPVLAAETPCPPSAAPSAAPAPRTTPVGSRAAAFPPLTRCATPLPAAKQHTQPCLARVSAALEFGRIVVARSTARPLPPRPAPPSSPLPTAPAGAKGLSGKVRAGQRAPAARSGRPCSNSRAQMRGPAASWGQQLQPWELPWF